MKKYRLYKEQHVKRQLAEVFQFFERPENLVLITPPWLGFRTLTPSPISMKEETAIDYSIRVMGVRMKWRSLISEYDPPRTFTDEQIRGPYALWRHTHTFTESDGGTIIGDDVEYALPFGIIGRIVQPLIIRRQLEGIFKYRALVIERTFNSGD